MGDFWVFGYGSLMWNPGFAHVETIPARLAGYRRALCIHSHVYRGTPQSPGLVLGLDRGGSCLGMAFRVPGALEGEVMDYLRARELVTGVYLERRVGLRLGDGRQVGALTYVCDRHHEQYAGPLTVAAAAEIVAGASGRSGPNRDYVFNTLDHLSNMGIRDHWLESVAEKIRLSSGA
ncbi:MAG: gamma-glutamylcyclotransferase [Phyllobacterium sp.]